MTNITCIIQGETRLRALFILDNHNKQEMLLLGLPAEDWQFPGSPYCLQTHEDKAVSSVFPFWWEISEGLRTTVP